MRLVTLAVAAGQTNSVSSSQAAEEHENFFLDVVNIINVKQIQTKQYKQTLCPRLKLLWNTRMIFFLVQYERLLYAVLRFSGSTCCIITLHKDKVSTLL